MCYSFKPTNITFEPKLIISQGVQCKSNNYTKYHFGRISESGPKNCVPTIINGIKNTINMSKYIK